MTAANNGISVVLLLSVLCLGLAMMFVGGWYFHSSLVELNTKQQSCLAELKAQQQASLVELKAQQQETAQIVQQLKEKVRKQSKQLNELHLQIEMKQFKVSIKFNSYNSK